MTRTFDEAYARYRSILTQLDNTEDIAEKNRLFRQLREQLSDLESRLSNKNIFNSGAAPERDAESTYWI